MPIANIPVTSARSSREPDQQVHLEGLLDERRRRRFRQVTPSPRLRNPAKDTRGDKAASNAARKASRLTAASGQVLSPPAGSVGVDPVAFWDAHRGIFRIRVHHSPTF